jgi:hypothetical protein
MAEAYVPFTTSGSTCGHGQQFVGNRIDHFGKPAAGAEEGLRILEHELGSGLGAQPVGFRAGRHAKAAAVACVEMQVHRNQAGGGVDLRPQSDAVFGTGVDATTTSLAVLGKQIGLGTLANGAHELSPPTLTAGAILLAARAGERKLG